MSPSGTRPGRAPLDRGRVLAAAVALADRSGLDAVSMRSLAAELGVVPMALYKHVSDKRDLVDGMLDTVISGYPAPSPEADWREAVRSRILAARESLLRHPWFRAAVETSPRPTMGALGHMNTLAGEFIRGGVSPDLTHYAMHALGHRIWGFSPEAFRTPEGPPPAPSDHTTAQLAEAFPYVAAIVADATARNPDGGCDEDAEFVFTLDLLLEAVDRMHVSAWASRPLR